MTRKKIKIGFVGDFCLAQAHKKPSKYLMENYAFSKELNDQVDISIANLEFCISQPDTEDKRGMILPALHAENISDAGFDVFCLANNHIKDFGSDTMLHSKKFLEARGHYTAGVGKCLIEANQPLYVKKNGFEIAIINVCDDTRYAAGINTPGISPMFISNLKTALLQARSKADVVIICLHSDLEFINSPAPWRVALSRKLAELGPDIIIHHHPHTLQGMEYWKNTFIAYSLGNFIFPIHDSKYMENRVGHIDESLYLTVTLSDNEDKTREISHSIIPLIIDEQNYTKLAPSNLEKDIRRKIKEYSYVLNDTKELRRIYFKLCKENMRATLFGIYYRVARKDYKVTWEYFKHHFSTNFHIKWIKGFFTFGRY